MNKIALVFLIQIKEDYLKKIYNNKHNNNNNNSNNNNKDLHYFLKGYLLFQIKMMILMIIKHLFQEGINLQHRGIFLFKNWKLQIVIIVMDCLLWRILMIIILLQTHQ